MAKKEIANQTHSVDSETSGSHTFLGGVRLNSRVVLFVLLGFLAVIAMGGVFFNADQRLNVALSALKSSYQVASLVSRVESTMFASNSDSQKFLFSKERLSAENYAERSGEAARLLSHLKNVPAALDGQKIITTLTEGITQQATHFQNMVGIQSIIGLGKNSGLTGRANISGSVLQRSITVTRNKKLISQVNTLRELELGLQNFASSEDIKVIMGAMTNIRQSIIASTLPNAVKASVRKSMEAYTTDVERLVQTRLSLAKEIARMKEVGAILALNLKLLITFSRNLNNDALRTAGAIQTELRQILAGGAVIIIFFFTFLGTILMRSIVRPINSLAHAGMLLSGGNVSVIIPAIDNRDETGEVAIALTYFRKNMVEANRLREQLEIYLQDSNKRSEQQKPKQQEEEVRRETSLPDAEIKEHLKPETSLQSGIETTRSAQEELEKLAGEPATTSDLPEDREVSESINKTPDRSVQSTPISQVSQLVAQTSQSASTAAKGAERCDVMVSGLADSLKKINDIELLLASISDHMSLLAVQTAITNEKVSDDSKNLILLSEQRAGENQETKVSEFVSDNIDTLQNGTKRAIRAIQQVGKTIKEVNEVALQIAAEASYEALDAATKLLHQSEDLRGMLDGLLGKIKPDEKAKANS